MHERIVIIIRKKELGINGMCGRLEFYALEYGSVAGSIEYVSRC